MEESGVFELAASEQRLETATSPILGRNNVDAVKCGMCAVAPTSADCDHFDSLRNDDYVQAAAAD